MSPRPIRFHELPKAGLVAAGGGAIALTHGERSLDYDELCGRIAPLAATLFETTGLERGGRLAIYLEKRIETVEAMLAASAIGAVFVPINPALKPAQVRHILADSGAGALVTSAPRLDALRSGLGVLPNLRDVFLVDDLPPAAALGDTGPRIRAWPEYDDRVGAQQPVAPETIDLDPAAIFYTSGSTGRPKGVVVSHRNLVAGAENVNAYLGNGPTDRILAALPLSFDAGFSQLSTAFAAGASVTLLDYLLPADVVGACAREGVTGLTCVPPLWLQLAEREWPAEASDSLRYFASTGGRMPTATLTSLRRLFPRARPFLMYGLTEAFRSTYLDPAEIDRRPDSIGKAIPNAEVLVLRPDGSECAPGEPGELVHRGATVALCYWNDPERTAERFRPIPNQDGMSACREPAVWSGDTVYRDDEGFIYFVERKDEMIKTSGYRVSPTEIEDAAYGCDLVAEAVAVGLADERLGQTVALVIRPEDGDPALFDVEALRAALRRDLPRYMLPSRIEALAALPRSANGKFDRQAIRAALEKKGL